MTSYLGLYRLSATLIMKNFVIGVVSNSCIIGNMLRKNCLKYRRDSDTLNVLAVKP